MQGFLVWTGRLAILCAVVSAVTLFLSGFGYKQQWWQLGPAFTMLRVVVYTGGGACLLGLLTLLVGLKLSWRQSMLGLVAVLIGGAAAAVPVGMRKQAQEVPPIHDITTDTQNPPAFVAIAPLRADAPNDVSYAGSEITDQQLQAYPDLKTIRVEQTADEVFEVALKAAESFGWEIVAAEKNDGRIEATETTQWYGFKDDVVIRIRDSGSVTAIDVRSKSRVGKSDLGLNAKRIRLFKEALLSRLLAT